MRHKRVLNALAWPRSHGKSTALRGFSHPKGPSYAFRSPYAEEFLEAAPESSPFPWLSPALTGSALLCPLRANMTALQDSLDGADCCVAPPSRRGILRFSTPGHPGALGACYVSLWRLPRPDLHRQVVSAFQGTPALGQAPAPHLRDLVDGWPKRRRGDGLPGRFRRLEPCFLRLENLG